MPTNDVLEPTCGGWERRSPHLLTSQSKWQIFKCDKGTGVWHINGPARSWDGTVMGISVEYGSGLEAIDRFDRGWTDNAPYAKKKVAP